MRKRKIVKEAVVLLIITTMFLSTVVVSADTNEENAVCLTFKPISNQTNLNYGKTRDRAILWDNYDTDGINGLSHADRSVFGEQRALLDDFEIPVGDTWILTDLHSLNLWNTMQPGQGTDFHLEFWSDSSGTPGSSIVTAVTVSYTETATGRTWFSRPEFEIEYVYEPITLTEGRYWIYGFVIGPENCFWMAKETIWGTPCWLDYENQGGLQPGYNIFGADYDIAFQLTGSSGPPPMIVEKYVLCPCDEEWIDADTEEEALDLPICTDATFKIVIKNDGDCPLVEIAVYDMMHDSLEYISADPEPEQFSYDPPYYYLFWFFPGPLNPGETIEIYITAHVNGPHCSIDFNYVEVIALLCGETEVYDDDWAYVHAFENEPPNKPIIDGPLKGEPDIEYCWTFKSTDPNGDGVRFEIDWGDGTSDSSECVPSGTEVEVCHTYSEQATYVITAIAIDCCWGEESEPSTTHIKIPRSRALNSPILNFLENFPNIFQILRYILGI